MKLTQIVLPRVVRRFMHLDVSDTRLAAAQFYDLSVQREGDVEWIPYCRIVEVQR